MSDLHAPTASAQLDSSAVVMPYIFMSDGSRRRPFIEKFFLKAAVESADGLYATMSEGAEEGVGLMCGATKQRRF